MTKRPGVRTTASQRKCDLRLLETSICPVGICSGLVHPIQACATLRRVHYHHKQTPVQDRHHSITGFRRVHQARGSPLDCSHRELGLGGKVGGKVEKPSGAVPGPSATVRFHQPAPQNARFRFSVPRGPSRTLWPTTAFDSAGLVRPQLFPRGLDGAPCL
ncbi:hypothetical protein BGZ61DRAFT_110757 [Ilyonectria robusta]|uniref:uncharacterized protein n=1 Tax=Ilyonectria robusta TaxID=1079257 RepID=UPI001E8DD9F9|nr:uncharacterized protein BGZ61DRAFT_110757 [Ilyonectria robusta]KAH8669822.1 hypothetical protein BGZ61DRAFT_110757 [Ilyonectria robusta]